jgi:hypothetical protein
MAPAASSFEEAYGLLFRILNEVEDELSPIPYNVNMMDRDGRLYPPLWDNTRRDPSRPRVWRLRSRGHVTMIGDNGSIAIEDIASGSIVYEKAGADGLQVDQL